MYLTTGLITAPERIWAPTSAPFPTLRPADHYLIALTLLPQTDRRRHQLLRRTPLTLVYFHCKAPKRSERLTRRLNLSLQSNKVQEKSDNINIKIGAETNIQIYYKFYQQNIYLLDKKWNAF